MSGSSKPDEIHHRLQSLGTRLRSRDQRGDTTTVHYFVRHKRQRDTAMRTPGNEVTQKSQSGAPQSMKIGTIAAPWRYDVVATHTVMSPIPRSPSIFHYASSCSLLSGLASVADTPETFDPMLLVRGDLTSNRSYLTELQMCNRRKQSPVAILRTKLNFADYPALVTGIVDPGDGVPT